ncbi:uncharacterized protein LOC134100672 [Sardina pilchardus]|uniref:uncharacterized protein LOC134100672 n=1 Tax=Sardina pilchardus TaxID=27697 RepID=UPI002E120381
MATITLTVAKAIPDIVSKGMAIHSQLMQVKKNKKRCARLADRVKAVVDPLVLAEQGVKEEVVQKALDVVNKVLEEAETLMEKYEKTHWIKKTFNAKTLKEDFDEVNLHLTEASHHLCACLQVLEHKDRAKQQKILEDVFNDQRILKENFEDMKIDEQEWEKLLSLAEETKDVVDATDRKMSALQRDVHDIKVAVGAGPPVSQESAASTLKATDQVFNIRCELINRINDATLKAVLDGLQKPTSDKPPVIKGRERNEVLLQCD